MTAELLMPLEDTIYELRKEGWDNQATTLVVVQGLSKLANNIRCFYDLEQEDYTSQQFLDTYEGNK